MEEGMVQVENRNNAPDPIAYSEDTLSLARQLYHPLGDDLHRRRMGRGRRRAELRAR